MFQVDLKTFKWYEENISMILVSFTFEIKCHRK